MEKTTTHPVLNAIDAAAFGASVYNEVRTSVEALARQLGCTLSENPEQGDLETLATGLANYAQSGSEMSGYPLDAVQFLANLFSRRVADIDIDLPPPTWNPRVRSEVDVVLRATIAREDILHGVDITQASLATLASLSPQHLRVLEERHGAPMRSEYRRTHVLYDAVDCRRWLAERGVPGFE